MKSVRILAGCLALLALAAAAGPGSEVSRAVSRVSAHRIKARIAFLADDLLEGRGTGARGSEIAARYIATEFAGDGLKPAAERGTSYLQKMELVGMTTVSEASTLSIGPSADPLALENGKNAVYMTFRQQGNASIDAPMVYVGYGITAPEQRWDDYAELDASGKVVVCLVNDPPSDDPTFFGGKALTYYGRWTYKYENAARHGALGTLLVHTDESAGYGWQVVQSSWGGERSELPAEPGEYSLALAGWMTKEAAAEFFRRNGLELAELQKKAGERGFRAVLLTQSRARGTVASKIRRFSTENVAGVLTGRDPKLEDEYIILTAHFDHLGIGKPDSRGDAIYNGAKDNAAGTAILLEMARAAADAGFRPGRSVLFLAVTAEEQGLLGSAYYAKHPLVPLSKTAANINMDDASLHGELLTYCLLGLEKTSLEPVARRIARSMGIGLEPDAKPEQGEYYRSDHFSLARAGVPALSVNTGDWYRGHDRAWGRKIFEDYNENRYHQPSDEFDLSWDLSGAVQEARLVLRLTSAISSASQMPTWKKGEEFEAARLASLKAGN